LASYNTATHPAEQMFARQNYSPIQTYVIKEKHAALKLRTYYMRKRKKYA